MGTLKGLAKRLNDRADDLDQIANRAAIWFAKRVVRDLIAETPVDTSRALANWLISFDAPGNYATLEYAPGLAGSTAGTSRAMAIKRAHTKLDAKLPGQVIYISNVVRYIVYLNKGSSGQAPAKYVETIIIRAKVELRRKIKRGDFDA